MTDTILEAIDDNTLNTNNISFDRVRALAGVDRGLWDALGRGRRILDDLHELDQYLYSYGPMIQSQWDTICENLNVDDGTITLIDYGCGQGIASLLLRDNLGDNLAGDVREVILIEPSSIALDRAEGIINCCYPDADIICINKKLDDLSEDELTLNDEDIKIHLMSNILDVEGFDHFELFQKLLGTEGTHYIIAVSHDRDFNGGSGRLEELYNCITEDDPDYVKEASLIRFTCGNNKPAIAFTLKLEL